MIVKLIKTGKTKEVAYSYGLRLIEQGKAVAVKQKPARPAKKDSAKPAGDT